MKKKILITFFYLVCYGLVNGQSPHLSDPSAASSIFLRSFAGDIAGNHWELKKLSEVIQDGGKISSSDYVPANWLPAIVPGTVLNSLVYNKIYPEPYFGDNNKITKNLIPDIAVAGREFYHYWFRTAFKIPQSFAGKTVWLKFHGINYRCVIWVNGKKLGEMAGMFNAQSYDISSVANRKGDNIVAVDISPVDFPGAYNKPGKNRNGAVGENHNGGDGEVGKNVSMLMSVGWDFTAPDGIRDRNTGIWKDVELFATGKVILENPFIQTSLSLPDTTVSRQTISVEVANRTSVLQHGTIAVFIKEANIHFQKNIILKPRERKTIIFTPEEFGQLIIKNPKLWWPLNKGSQYLYTLQLDYNSNGIKSHSITTRFGIRTITSDQNTPDKSRRFYVNGYPIFIRGSNWVPEAMLRNSESRTSAELKYTRQAGINLLRLWGGGIAESDYFYRLCDEMGILVWTEFWITGDTNFPSDTSLYLRNLENTVKRIRNHASLAYYVSSNESKEVPGAGEFIHQLDSSRGYQVQSECCGVHDGSPYKYENPMQYFENTASARGSRVDGFNPEYGTPILPTIESLREMMPEKDLWPINDSVWNYLDGGGFHQMTTKYKQAVNEFGLSSSIEEFAKKAQFVGAMNFRAIWEVWNYNKFEYGDRFSAGFLFWYHNSPLRQTAARMYDWSLEPTAALYYSQNGLAPLHPQFDYFKNTVSVYNDYRKAFQNFTVEATVFDIFSKPVLSVRQKINIPSDGVVNNAIKINFPKTISQVHFIKLVLKDDKGKFVSEAFYWRSSDLYKGAWTMTGPAVSGFGDISKLPKTELKLTARKKISNGLTTINALVKNGGNSLSFFTQVKVKDSKGNIIKPAFYTDNFFCILPGESKHVTIEIPGKLEQQQIKLSVESWNAEVISKIPEQK